MLQKLHQFCTWGLLGVPWISVDFSCWPIYLAKYLKNKLNGHWTTLDLVSGEKMKSKGNFRAKLSLTRDSRDKNKSVQCDPCPDLEKLVISIQPYRAYGLESVSSVNLIEDKD